MRHYIIVDERNTVLSSTDSLDEAIAAWYHNYESGYYPVVQIVENGIIVQKIGHGIDARYPSKWFEERIAVAHCWEWSRHTGFVEHQWESTP